MSTAELDSFLAFNDQLLALSEAGVPIEVGREIPDRDLARMLARINASVSRQVSRGDSVADAIEAEEAVPDWYRSLILSGLQNGNVDETLRDFSRVADSSEESQLIADSALFYPIVVCSLAYLGMIGFCLFFVPRMESAYASFEIKPGTGLALLEKIRDTLPFWIAIPPVLLLLLFAWRFLRRSYRALSTQGGSGLLAAISGTSNAMYHQRCAHFAETLASLEQKNISLDKALSLSADACGDQTLANGARLLAITIPSGSALNDESGAAQQFPPFMRWALFDAMPTVSRNRALQMAAAFYRDASRRSMRRATVLAPIIGLVIIGGSVTLLYCLAVFMPVIQMLRAVASPH